MHDLVRTEVVSLVVPTIEGGPPCVDTLFPAPCDKFRYAEPALRLLENRATSAMLETDVASIQLQAVVWRSKYIQMFVTFSWNSVEAQLTLAGRRRGWIVVVSEDEQRSSERVPGVRLSFGLYSLSFLLTALHL